MPFDRDSPDSREFIFQRRVSCVTQFSPDDVITLSIATSQQRGETVSSHIYFLYINCFVK